MILCFSVGEEPNSESKEKGEEVFFTIFRPEMIFSGNFIFVKFLK